MAVRMTGARFDNQNDENCFNMRNEWMDIAFAIMNKCQETTSGNQQQRQKKKKFLAYHS